MAQLQTEVHVIERHAEGLIQTAHFIILGAADQEAGSCHCGHILRIAETAHIAQMHLVILVMGMAGRPVGSQSYDNARMLNGVVRVVELRSHSGHVRALGIHQKLLHPLPGDDFHVIVQQQHIFSVCKSDAEIVDAGIIKVSLIFYNADLRIVLQRLVIIKNFFGLAVIFHNHNLVILIRGFIDNGFHTAGQILHMILVRNHNRDQRTLQKRIAYPENRGERSRAFYLRVHAIDVHDMIVNGSLGRVHRIGLCVDILGYGRFMGTPVIQGLRHMVYFFRLPGQAQNHIVILASIVLAAEHAGLVQQMSGKSGKMTDIVIAPQIVNGKVRFEVQHNHVIDAVALERNLIAVNVIRARLIDGLHILVKHGRMQNVIMVQKSDIIAGGHLQALVRVAGDSFVVIQHAVKDTGIFRRIFSADLSHIGMLVIASVSQTQLPVLVGLIFYTVQKLRQKLFRCIIKRRQNTEFHHIGEDFLPLALRLLR